MRFAAERSGLRCTQAVAIFFFVHNKPLNAREQGLIQSELGKKKNNKKKEKTQYEHIFNNITGQIKTTFTVIYKICI